MKVKSVIHLDQVKGIKPEELEELRKVSAKYAFASNEYYLSLIDWNDPDDPIRRIIVPCREEMDDWGSLDPSNESRYTVMPGVEHKYYRTVLVLASNACAGICRFCFRKRIFQRGHAGVVKDVDAALKYIRDHEEVTNVLLTGGDPLMLATSRIEKLVASLRAIDHVRIIRIGTKMVAYNPHRILDDKGLLEIFRRYSTPEKRIYVITHFSHERELTDAAVRAIDEIRMAGGILANQTPLLMGVNSDPKVLARLFQKLSFVGDPPYYVFQCRPAIGNRTFAVPIEEGYLIFEKAKSMVSGLAKRARFVMSHASGKIEIVAVTKEHTYFKYHRAASDEDCGKIMVFKRNTQAYWFDDYKEPVFVEKLFTGLHQNVGEDELV
ncbi:MAG: KamA family radical SAM protein [Methanobacteriota archaeon]